MGQIDFITYRACLASMQTFFTKPMLSDLRTECSFQDRVAHVK